MSTSGIAATALEFLGSIDPDDSIWDDGGIEQFVEEVHALATQKRLARERFAMRRAIAALRAEVDSLSVSDVEVELLALERADLSKMDPSSVVPRIQALTTAIAAYRQDERTASDESTSTISERKTIYEPTSSLFPRPKQVSASTQKTVGTISRQTHNSTPVTRAMWTVAYFLARYGRRVGGGPASAPTELGDITWKDAFHLFYASFNDGRNSHRFRKRLENCRDSYDRYVDSGRRGWDAKLTATATAVLNEWQNRPREELWEYVKQFVTR